jgi:hypothetical protein
MNHHINNINCDVKTLNDNNDFSNKKKIRRNKKELYSVERQEFISKLNDILKLELNNYAIIYNDLIENEELKKFLIDNIELIKKYWAHAHWGYFTGHFHNCIKSDEISLMKSIYKDENYKFASKVRMITRAGVKKKHTEIHFILPNNIN